MPWRDALSPAQMKRIALLAPADHSHDMLAAVGRSGVVELDLPYVPGSAPDELDRVAQSGVNDHGTVGWVGWVPARELAGLTVGLAGLGAAVVPIAPPRGRQPPTLLGGRQNNRVSRSLVDTYGTVPYADIDPSRLAGIAYVVMFGMMFGDVGHGAILLIIGLLLRSGKIRRLQQLGRTWAFVAGAGLTSMFFGALYGEAFGPTGLIPVLWLNPLADPIPLLVAALVLGAVLLAGAYALGTVNRVREAGWGYALYASSGAAGSVLFLSLGLLVWGVLVEIPTMAVVAAVLAATALTLIFIGFFVDAGGGATGAMQASIEVVDAVIRLGSNVVSFARLAAFGLTHAALLTVVWTATVALWQPDARALAAVVVFIVGNVLTFGLEALVAGVQALRLEYYELFSRIFDSEGRAFHPWVLEPTPEHDAVSSTDPGPIGERHHL